MTSHHVTACDCGFRSRACRSAPQAAYALRQHSCAKHRAEAASAARNEARHRAVDRTQKPCLHKETQHEHGTHACYVLDRCRCLPCAAANSNYENHRLRQRAYGREAYVDTAPVVAHVRELMAAGVGLKQIVKVSGVSSGSLWKLVYGKKGADGIQHPSTRCRQVTAEKLLAVRADFSTLACGARVDPTGTRRRVQALVVAGWSQQKLADRLGMTRGNFGHTMQCDRIVARTARRVAELYDELWNTAPPEATHRDRLAASRARNYARRLGWLPALAWDDDTIDQPSAQPMLEADGAAELDEIAVLRIMAGDLQLQRWDRSLERTEAIRRMAARGLNDAQIAGYIGLTRDAVFKVRERNGITSTPNDAHQVAGNTPGYGPSLRPEKQIDAIASGSTTSEGVTPAPRRRTPAA